ncbi:MAG: LamG-like jellyroll fold domain-containing protein, partial [Brumimicrobium sp.]
MKNKILKLLLILPVFMYVQGFTQTTYNVPELIYYNFNNAGTTVDNDASAPVGTNPAPISGLTVGAGGFAGTDGLLGTGASSSTDIINTGWNASATGDFTIAFYTSDIPAAGGIEYIFGDNGASGFRCFTNGAAGSGNWLVRGLGANLPDITLTGGATMAPKMNHVVYNSAAGTLTGYVNGVQVAQEPAPNSINVTTGTGLTVGGYETNLSLNGVLDEFRWYDRALDANEIGLTYNQELPFTVVCDVPENFSESNVTANSADISWDHGPTNGNYELEYGPAGFTPGTGSGTIISGAITGASITENISGLNPNTVYEYYITEDCNGGADELTFGPYSFTTSCGVVTAPYTENFDDPSWDAGNGGINQCWSLNPTSGFMFETNTGGTTSTNTGPSDDFTGGGKYVYTEASTGSTGDIAEITSLDIDISGLTDPFMTFHYHMYGQNIVSLEVEVSNDGGNTWTNEVSINGEQQSDETDPWEEQGVSLLPYVGDTIQVKFLVERGGNYYNDIAIDEIEIDEVTGCPDPTSLTLSNITANDAELDWSAGYQETEWVIEYDTAGFPQGTGTTIVTNNLNETLTGLSAITDYDVYVKGVCGVGDSSEWVGPASFTTPCVVYSAPFHEPFDNGVEPDCWENLATGTFATDFWKFDGTPGNAAANNGRPDDTYAWSDGSGNEPEGTLITPYIDVT